LIRYVLAAAQSPKGGLRDKPGKGADFYHTNYVLLGLSGAQYYHFFNESVVMDSKGEGLPLLTPFQWRWKKEVPGCEVLVEGFEGWPEKRWGDEDEHEEREFKGDRVAVAHPVFNIRSEYVEEAEKWAEGLVGF
jgi:protein farnesyltransferase subunit beta